MRLLVTGATGVIGEQVVPRLLAGGHDVDAAVRSSVADAMGARPVEVDLFDGERVRAAVRGVDGVVHLATAIPPLARMHRRHAWVVNDRLRVEATRNLVDAAFDLGAELFVFPSITFNYADGGDRWLDEDAPLDPPFGATESALVAEGHVARFTAAGGRGIVLRLARLYGPGRASAPQIEQYRAGRAIVVGSGDNYVSSLHTQDAGSAIHSALTATAGIYNVSDDEPQTALGLAMAVSDALGVDPPRRVPAPVARVVAGKASRLLTVSQRVSNQRLRDATGWAPAHPRVTDWWGALDASTG